MITNHQQRNLALPPVITKLIAAIVVFAGYGFAFAAMSFAIYTVIIVHTDAITPPPVPYSVAVGKA